MRRAAALALACALLLSGCRREPPTVTVYESAPPVRVSESDRAAEGERFVLNPSSARFHRPGCVWAEKIAPERRIDWTGDREDLIAVGYRPCSFCKP